MLQQKEKVWKLLCWTQRAAADSPQVLFQLVPVFILSFTYVKFEFIQDSLAAGVKMKMLSLCHTHRVLLFSITQRWVTRRMLTSHKQKVSFEEMITCSCTDDTFTDRLTFQTCQQKLQICHNVGKHFTQRLERKNVDKDKTEQNRISKETTVKSGV